MRPVNPDRLGGWRLTRSGLLLLALTTLSGFVIPMAPNHQLAMIAHVHTLVNGLMLLALGMPWPALRMRLGPSVAASWALIISCYGFVLITWTCALAQIGERTFPILFAGHMGSPLAETLIRVATIAASIMTAYGLIAAAIASFRSSGL